MKKLLSGFFAGVIATVIFSTLIVPAIAASIEVLFNSVNITLDGNKVAQIGETYTLGEGIVTNYSLKYDGTVYLPVRKLSELLGLDVQWDQQTQTVNLSKSDTTNLSIMNVDPVEVLEDDIEINIKLSDLSYEEFKSLLTLDREVGNRLIRKEESAQFYYYYLTFGNNIDEVSFLQEWALFLSDNGNMYLNLLLSEYDKITPYNTTIVVFEYNNKAFDSICVSDIVPITIDESTNDIIEQKYQEFKDLWNIEYNKTTTENEILYNITYNGDLEQLDFLNVWSGYSETQKKEYAKIIIQDIKNQYQNNTIAIYFKYNNTDLGYCFCYTNNQIISSFYRNPFIED